jgi:hypothetical protein
VAAAEERVRALASRGLDAQAAGSQHRPWTVSRLLRCRARLLGGRRVWQAVAPAVAVPTRAPEGTLVSAVSPRVSMLPVFPGNVPPDPTSLVEARAAVAAASESVFGTVLWDPLNLASMLFSFIVPTTGNLVGN